MGTVNPHSNDATQMAKAISDASEVLALLWGRMAEDMPQRLSLPQLRALLLVKHARAMTVTALAEAMDASVSSASRLGDRLVAAGLLRRGENTGDRRGYLLHLTPGGSDVLVLLSEARAKVLTSLLERVSPAARQALLTGLRELTDAAKHPQRLDAAADTGA